MLVNISIFMNKNTMKQQRTLLELQSFINDVVTYLLNGVISLNTENISLKFYVVPNGKL